MGWKRDSRTQSPSYVGAPKRPPINKRILQTMVLKAPLVLGGFENQNGPHVYVVFGAPYYGVRLCSAQQLLIEAAQGLAWGAINVA